MEYRPDVIEKEWRRKWKENGTYKVENQSSKPKYYVLDMFPYPSGAGLHVGHPLGYIASDILSRYKRLKGFNVLHPMGFDAFGLPAEQYAIENGIHPAVSTKENIGSFKKQLDNLGLCYDWSREVQTCDPKYYRWTQWIFLQMFNHWYDTAADKAKPISELIAHFEKNGNAGVTASTSHEESFTAAEWQAMKPKEQEDVLMNYRLMYRKVGYVNWCEALGTVLANDEVINGVSERGGYPVEIRPMLQWSMRITAYAERLLHGLDTVDYPEGLKMLQRNWIGRSEGAQVFFDIEGFSEKLEIYTTRPDTIFGATFMVVAPEHDLVEIITTDAQRAEIQRYLDWVKSRNERERQIEKVVSGAFTGAHAIHPFTGERLPIFIAEYVLKGYGTGAIMAVPADDERDLRFAEKFNLPVVNIIDKTMYSGASIEDKVGKMINSGFLDGMEVVDAISEATRRLEEMSIGKKHVQYKLRDANYSRQRYWGEPFPIVYDAEGVAHALPENELPLELPHTTEFKPGGGKGPLARLTEWANLPDGWVRDTDTMPGFAGSSWYFLRYMDPHNDEVFASPEAIAYWRDVDFYIGGAEHAVGHLLYSRMWHKFLKDKGLVPTEEPYRKVVNQGMIQGVSKFVFRATEKAFFEEYIKKLLGMVGYNFKSESKNDRYFWDIKGHNQNDIEVYIKVVSSHSDFEKIENEAKKLRINKFVIIDTNFIAAHSEEPSWIVDRFRIFMESSEQIKFFIEKSYFPLFVPLRQGGVPMHVDIQLVNEDNSLKIEEFKNWREEYRRAKFILEEDGRYICSEVVEKMSKSKYNVVNPDDMVNQYGADCFRMYEMFLGPIEVGKPWDTKGITGVSGFLKKFWGLFFNGKGEFEVTSGEPTKDELRALHTCIKKVSDDIERFSMNTCVSHFMIVTNELRRLNCSKRAVLEPIVILLAPFAPHIAEEIWHRLGHATSVCDAVWPVHNEEYLKTDTKEYPIQINGKLRATVTLPTDVSAAEAEKAALALEQVQKWLDGQAPKKVVFVPGRMINVVV